MPKFNLLNALILLLIVVFTFQGCTTQSEITSIPIEIIIDEKKISLEIEIGSTIQTVLSSQEIVLNPLDKVDPPVFTVITEPVSIKISVSRKSLRQKKLLFHSNNKQSGMKLFPKGKTFSSNQV
jgi:hypothetical protein